MTGTYPYKYSGFRDAVLLQLGAVFLIMISLLLLSGHRADAAEAVGKVTYIEGKVDILKGGQLPAIAAKLGDAVSVSDMVRTKSDSKAEITFNDGNILRLAQRSRIDISEYISGAKGVIKLPRGKIEAVVEKKTAQRIAFSKDANRFEVHTPNAVAGVRGTQFFVLYDRNVTGVAVKEGVVGVYNIADPHKVVDVLAGQMTNVRGKEQPQPPKQASGDTFSSLIKEVTPDKKKDSGDKSGGKSDEGSQKPGAGTSAGTSTNAGGGSGTPTGGDSGSKTATVADNQGSNTGTTNQSGQEIKEHMRHTDVGYAYTPASAPTPVSTVPTGDLQPPPDIVTVITPTTPKPDIPVPLTSTTTTTVPTTTTTVTTTTVATTTVPTTTPTTVSTTTVATTTITTTTVATTTVKTTTVPTTTVSTTTVTTTALTTVPATTTIPATTSSQTTLSVLGNNGGTLSISVPTTNTTTAGTLAFSVPNYSNPTNAKLWGSTVGGTTSSGGAYTGYMGGTTPGSPAYGEFGGLVIENGQIGFLYGSFSGDLSGVTFAGSGPLNKYLVDTTSVPPGYLYPGSPSVVAGFGENLGNATVGVNGDISGNGWLGSIALPNDGWGILWGGMQGSYASTLIGGPWTASIDYVSSKTIIGIQIAGDQWNTIPNSDVGKLHGKQFGYYASIAGNPDTGIMVGETVGTFNPTTWTYQAVLGSTLTSTNKFLSMACPGGFCNTTGTSLTAGQQRLQQINVPVIEVGRTDLSGSLLSGTDNMSVQMNNVVFFAPTNGAKPAVWATNQVSGSYSLATSGQLGGVAVTDPKNTIPISNGGDITANFQFKTWTVAPTTTTTTPTANGQWMGSITNGTAAFGTGTMSGGTYNGSVNFKGAAAGAITGTPNAGTFNGTAAGVTTK